MMHTIKVKMKEAVYKAKQDNIARKIEEYNNDMQKQKEERILFMEERDLMI